MLDLAGYRDDLMGKRFLENSFGDGRFLAEAVRRYLVDACDKGVTTDVIVQGLQRDITGIEIDERLVSHARSLLDDCARSFGIAHVEWDLRCVDALRLDSSESFDFIVGNPPYVEYKALGSGTRSWMREHFESCQSGKFDYCYAFVESALSHLVSNGILVQLLPGSIFKNLSAGWLRAKLLDGITDVIDFAGRPVFDGALVSPCILKYARGSTRQTITYRDWDGDHPALVRKNMLADKWVFCPVPELTAGEGGALCRFGDRFHASMPVATLLNEAFLLDEASDVEEDLVRLAASPRVLRDGGTSSIIFPYMLDADGVPSRYSAQIFEQRFPRAVSHLRGYADKLGRRKADAGAAWFEYGRSQGLGLIAKRKLLLSTVVTGGVNVYDLAEGTVPYGGIVITDDTSDGETLHIAKALLESPDFSNYARSIGTSISGSSVRITCRDVNEFRYRMEGEQGYEAAAL